MWREFRRQQGRLDRLVRYRAIVTLSAHMRDEYVRHGFDAARVFEVRAEPEGDAASPPGPPDAPGRDGWRLLFAGRMDRLKGGSYLIDALPRVARALGVPLRVTLAGDGPDRTRWERRAASCASREPSLSIAFTGWLGRGAIEALLAESDLLVLPSLWPEPFGLVGLEAARQRVPVAAFAVGGIPDWLHPGINGQLADGHPPTPEGLAAAVIACLKDRPTHARLRAGAGRISADRSFDRHVRTLLELFDRIVAGAES